ncbi:unnamed protein product [Urochloa humidicola]
MDPAATAAAFAEMDDLVEEVLIRCPPSDPARLARAALVCKRWCRILADAGFRHRFRERHRAPPMLGLLLRHESSSTSFAATSSFRPRGGDLRGRRALDSRHGRVLLARLPVLQTRLENNLSVWDPITGEDLELPKQPRHHEIVPFGWNAAVLCANGSCEHLGCHRGPFLIVIVCAEIDGVYVHEYSSEAGAWRTSAAHYGGNLYNLYHLDPSAYAENAIHFMFYSEMSTGILEYNVGTQEITQDLLPDDLSGGVLTTTENGGLGFARVDWLTLYLWSRQPGPNGYWVWTLSRTVNLGTMFAPVIGGDGYSVWPQSQTIELPSMFTHLMSSRVIGSVHGLHVSFVNTVDGLFSVDLKSGRAWRVCKDIDIQDIIPYVSFCIPALGEASRVEEPSAVASSA